MSKGFDWSEAAIAKLRALWAEGPSAAAIARALGGACTKNAVVGQARRLGLPARGSPLGLGNPSRVDWTDDQVARLKALRLIGQSDVTIGGKLGISESAVQTMRLKLQRSGALPQLVLPTGGRPHRPARPAHPPAAAKKPALRPECRGALGRAQQASRTPRGPLRYQVVSAEIYHRCCWPLWGDERPRPARHCEAAVVQRSSPYCAEHAALAYRQDVPARRAA
jgi:hypothetical protein